MAGIKLNKLKKEIKHYLNTPYWTNKLKKGKIIVKGPYDGKGNHKQIKLAIIEATNSKNLTLKNLSKKQVYQLQKKHNIGIDCSGLVYHLADSWYKINTGKSIKPFVVGTDNKTGPRRINVKMFSHPQNSHIVKDYSQIKTGDLIVTNQQRHVLFVVEINQNKISYVHSSQRTKNKGVHHGTLTITQPQKDLTHQQFSEIIEIHSSDAVYRLNVFN